MTATGTVRALVVLVELDYGPDHLDLDPALSGNVSWPVHSLPDWADNGDPTLNLLDPDEPDGDGPQGMMTRYMYEASSGNFILLADYLLAPTNGGIFSVPTTTGYVLNTMGTAICPQVNAAMNGTWATVHGHNEPSDYDHWTLTTSGENGPGRPKTLQAETPYKYDHVFFIFRNARDVTSGSGRAYASSPGALLGFGANTHTVFGAGNAPPVKLMCHEFCHLLFGANNFHCAGGGYNAGTAQYWISQSGGWSLMGLGSRSLDSWCGWDRLRMGWIGQGQTQAISARNENNTAEVNGDLDPLAPGDAGIYLLRDFVFSGDALRIKLPYTDPVDEYPEFIWVENHQGRNQNGHPYDKWQYEDSDCVIDLVPGLFMYMQIDRELHVTDNVSALYGGYDDYLRPIIASGHYDMDFEEVTQPGNCVGSGTAPAFVRALPNPLTGIGDTHWTPIDRDGDGDITRTDGDFALNGQEYADGTFHDNLFTFGHARHGFSPGGNTKLGIGTNPASTSMMNIVGENLDQAGALNHRRIQLNGVSIELLEQLPDGSIKVRVRFDDVDITNDVRWCADEIVLNPVPTANGYSLNVTTGNTLLIDRGYTATRRDAPGAFNGQMLFNDPTLMRCTDNTWLNMEANSDLIVDNGSTLRLEAGSRLDVADGAALRVRKGGTLELMGNSTLNVASGGLVIIEEDLADGIDGRLLYHPDARINLDATTSELEISGQLVIKENATFTTQRQTDPSTTYGRVRFSNTDQPSINVTAEANTRFVLQSNTLTRKILYVEQESLYGPDELVEFTLRKGTAVLSNKSRIVPTVSNYCSVNFVDARVTSPTSERNTHRGVRLNGQGILTLEGSTFSNGRYGIYSYNTVLGNAPELNDCLFMNCDKGMYNYDKGILATDTRFNGCDDGLYCEQMTKSSKLVHCDAVSNRRYGVYFRGVAKLRVTDPDFKLNDVGLAVHQASAFVECGNVSENRSAGFTVNGSALLLLQTNDGSQHQPVTAIDNPVTISCSLASNVGLKNGFNSLRPQVTGQQNTLYGTFLCQPYALYQEAYRNNWNGTVGTPLTSADYSINACGSPLYFVDPNSEAEVACGQAIPPCPHPPCPPDEFTYCPTCDEVETDEYGDVKLNVASAAARSVAENDALAGNEKEAIIGLNQILMNDIPAPSADERYLLEYDYAQLKESFSDALAKGQLDPNDASTGMDGHLALVEEVQEKRIEDAQGSTYDDLRFFTALEQAQIRRAAGKLTDAIDQLEQMLITAPAHSEALVEEVTCLTRMEHDVLEGILHWSDVETAMDLCVAVENRSMLASEQDDIMGGSMVNSVTIIPNPTVDEAALVFMAPWEKPVVMITYNAIGEEVARMVVPAGTPRFIFNTSTLAPAVYHYRVLERMSLLGSGRLTIVR